MRKYAWIAVLTVVLDQLTKFFSRGLKGPITLIPGLLGLRYAQNTGMAFSMFSGQSWLLGLLSAALIFLGWRILKRYPLGRWSRAAAMLMLGGAVGNMLDRLFLGYVIDMFEVLAFRFAIFNVADAALTVGCALMALTLVCCPDDWRENNAKDRTDR